MNRVLLMAMVLAALVLGCGPQQKLEPGAKGGKPLPPTDLQVLVAKATKENDVEAQLQLGKIYRTGAEVGLHKIPVNVRSAAKYLKMAGDNGNLEALNLLGELYEFGHPFLLPADHKKALEYYTQAGEAGYRDAQTNAGFMYEAGKGSLKNNLKAVEWYQKAAAQGEPFAQLHLANLYADGEEVTHDATEATRWYRKAAEQGMAEAQYRLGVHYQDGKGVTKDLSEAVKWYRKAAEQGHLGAQTSLGLLCNSGEGTSQDPVEAYKWLNIAAAKEYHEAVRYRDYIGLRMSVEDKEMAAAQSREFKVQPSGVVTARDFVDHLAK